MTTRVVRERIDPRLTASLFANYRSAIDALLELVDNAVDSRVSGRPLRVDLMVRPDSIVLTAIGGTGMGPLELERDYLRWGASRKRAGDRIGRYGQGGKAAIGHLGNRFSVAASREGDERAIAFDDPAYRDRAKLRVYELQDRAKPVEAAQVRRDDTAGEGRLDEMTAETAEARAAWASRVTDHPVCIGILHTEGPPAGESGP